MTEKRLPGRPRKAEGETGVRVVTSLPPALHAAWKADGRPLNELVRVALDMAG